jgi:hypothetical protein
MQPLPRAPKGPYDLLLNTLLSVAQLQKANADGDEIVLCIVTEPKVPPQEQSNPHEVKLFALLVLKVYCVVNA